ncbi:hypothetical protein [Azonexus hydrophilus]
MTLMGGEAVAAMAAETSKQSYLDLVVDCFLSGDEDGKKGNLTISDKTKPFGRFFKKIQYFGDEAGLIYYIDDLKIYKGKGIGLRFVDSVWVEKRPIGSGRIYPGSNRWLQQKEIVRG